MNDGSADREWTQITVQFRDELYQLIAAQKAEIVLLRGRLSRVEADAGE